MGAATLSLQDADALRPQSPGGMGRGALLALGVHGLLVVALALSVHWRSQTPQTFSAELWAATPQVAAPREVQSTPLAPPPLWVRSPGFARRKLRVCPCPSRRSGFPILCPSTLPVSAGSRLDSMPG